MTNLKKVSDVGLRYIADGCHLLEELNGTICALFHSYFDRSSIHHIFLMIASLAFC